ncbi:deoxyribonuclease V [Leptolyngbya sp. FACHB-711]|uniref:deoxyribonuclease V n=1 Tax=unclassified Leptolyngbya TaxID=2650499 RepID=UPI00168667B5|nr:deoxyribonuclease V [Leptolyngbya sp. FACHB-711]MBD1851050.1 deoxyribonuclease V [Cyanobacteria bacterium FACHB-502]MBD2026883.1 deoxyribonuclease V [Leptolyngbya sp. FACHB-711]
MIETQYSHAWNLSSEEAVQLQHRLKSNIITIDQLGEVRSVAGVDVGFEDGGNTTRAAVAVLSFPDLRLVERSVARRPTSFPYVPGLLSFREVPAVLDALEKLRTLPDLLLCDGQGTAHPRRFGIACHLGLLINLPAIGVGKSLLVGKYEEVLDTKGAWQPLTHRGETIGAVLRTRPGTKPLYISPGHRISLATAIDFVLRCTTRYRLPETTRFAHKLASETPAAQIDAMLADKERNLETEEQVKQGQLDLSI